MWFWYMNRHKDQWNITASAEIIPNIYDQLSFGWKKNENSVEQRIFFSIKKFFGKTRFQIKNDEFRTLSDSIQKIDLKCIIY